MLLKNWSFRLLLPRKEGNGRDPWKSSFLLNLKGSIFMVASSHVFLMIHVSFMLLNRIQSPSQIFIDLNFFFHWIMNERTNPSSDAHSRRPSLGTGRFEGPP